MAALLEIFTLLAGLISFIAIIVFFVMASNIGHLVSLNRTIKEQNFKIIELLRRNLPSDRLTDDDKVKIHNAMLSEPSKKKV